MSDSTELDALLARFSPEYSTWVRLGHRIGARALCAVLDELGGLKPHVPQSDTFWRGLERVVLAEQIRARHARGGCTLGEVAQEFSLTYRQAYRLLFEASPKKCADSDDLT